MVKRAIVRSLSPNYSSCVSDHPQLSELNSERATSQHKAYVNVLKEMGLDVIELEGLESYPDSCFVEDTAVIHNGKAMITHMGEPTRRGEGDTIAEILNEYFPIKHMDPSGNLEGGDVMHFPDHLVSGLSQRTNQGGVDQLAQWIGQPVKTIADADIVHLKSYMTPLDEFTVLVDQRYSNHPVLNKYDRILVPLGEEYASNSLTVNGVILIPAGYPQTMDLLVERGREVITLEVSEFETCEGALTCLSLLF
ncbi:MAG: dimethylarginine dimethylaminohydrolase family protein [Candidatus Kariarchaeaceae archaeon]